MSERDARDRALDALSRQRRGEATSLEHASRLVGLDPDTVLRYAGGGYQREGRRWLPKPFDRIPREMTILTEQGPEDVVVPDSRTASVLSQHANAVRRYRERADEAGLRRLPRTVQIGGRRYQLAIDPAILDWLIAGSELSYEVYRR